MEWLKKLLEAQGIDTSKIDAIINGANESMKNFIPKERFDSVNDEKKTYKQQVDDLNNQLETLKKTAGASEELKSQIQTLQTQISDKEKEVAGVRLDSAINLALINAKAKNSKVVANLLDKSKMTLDGDKVIGLEDQIKSIQQSDAYLFGEVNPGGTGEPGNPGGGKGNPSGEVSIGKMLAEQAKANNAGTQQSSELYFK
jgi:predicted RNase H-like nuclease (RuvC/YqgF family)